MYKLKAFHTFVNEAWMKTSPLSGELMAEYGDHIEKLHLYDWGQGFMELNDQAVRQSVDALQTPMDKARGVEGTLHDAAGRTADHVREGTP